MNFCNCPLHSPLSARREKFRGDSSKLNCVNILETGFAAGVSFHFRYARIERLGKVIDKRSIFLRGAGTIYPLQRALMSRDYFCGRAEPLLRGLKKIFDGLHQAAKIRLFPCLFLRVQPCMHS